MDACDGGFHDYDYHPSRYSLGSVEQRYCMSGNYGE